MKYIDPDGRIPLPIVTGIIGAIAGGAGNAIGQWAVNKCKPWDWTDFFIATGGGFVAGVAAPFIPGGAVGAVVWGGASNIGQYAAGSVIKGENMTAAGTMTNFATGIVGGAIGGAVGSRFPFPYAGTAASREMVDASNNAANVQINTGVSGLIRNMGGGVTGNAPISDMCECMR